MNRDTYEYITPAGSTVAERAELGVLRFVVFNVLPNTAVNARGYS
jgi:hypothetical protein